MTRDEVLVYSVSMSAISRHSNLPLLSSEDTALPNAESDPGSLAVKAWQPVRGPFQRWPRTMDAILAFFAFFLTLQMLSSDPEFAAGSSGDSTTMLSYGVALLLAVIGNFSLIWRRRNPLRVHAVIVACGALALANPLLEGIFGLAISLYSVGRYAAHDRASILAMLVALLLGTVDMFVLQTPSPGSFVAAGLMFLFWYVGRRLRFRGEYLRLLEERARYLEQRRTEAAEQAVAEERARIARELHDVVAHQVSLMTVQAGAAKMVAASDPGAALAAMAAVEDAGRQALSEMRQLLHVLRQDTVGGELAPQPGYADLASLAAEVRESGTVVQLTSEGPLSGLSPGVDLALYRIVQEALTNVIKHAGTGARATVRVRASEMGVELTISDDGRGPGMQPGHGFGIAGMRERAELLGGRLVAQPGPRGGFIVEVFLPFGDALS